MAQTRECTVSQAAAALGVSVASVRRGIKTGRYRARQQPTVQGYTWLVELPSPSPDEQVPDSRVPDARVSDAQTPDSRVPTQEAPTSTTTAILATRAQEMAEYTERLLSPWRAIVQQQAEEIGALKAQLAAQTQQSAPPPEEGAGRSWWRRLWGVG